VEITPKQQTNSTERNLSWEAEISADSQ